MNYRTVPPPWQPCAECGARLNPRDIAIPTPHFCDLIFIQDEFIIPHPSPQDQLSIFYPTINVEFTISDIHKYSLLSWIIQRRLVEPNEFY